MVEGIKYNFYPIFDGPQDPVWSKDGSLLGEVYRKISDNPKPKIEYVGRFSASEWGKLNQLKDRRSKTP
jgi:hypothetical protein